MDLDQGKKGKQRESVEICGAADAIITDDSEIELTTSGNCVKATSSTHGTGKDNPEVLEEMSLATRPHHRLQGDRIFVYGYFGRFQEGPQPSQVQFCRQPNRCLRAQRGVRFDQS